MAKRNQHGAARAYCFASGQIGFGERMPKGALPIASGPSVKALEEFISPLARHTYDGVTLLVPGVPEAADQRAAMDALFRFTRWIGSFAAMPQGICVIGSAADRS